MKFLFLFLDGVGLGEDDPEINPFAKASLPNLESLLDGKKLIQASLGEQNTPFSTQQATLLGIDANLGVAGKPQSASGQATILTGINIPKKLGYHYGPKPNPEIIQFLEENNLFSQLDAKGFTIALLNAFPEGYFKTIESGRRLPGAIAYAVRAANIALKTTQDLMAGEAISADFTGQGWHDRMKITSIPVLSPQKSGEKLAELARDYDFAFFEYWLSDYAGHRSDIQQACSLLETFDEMLGGLIASWDHETGLILITSDHGNLEDLVSRKHTKNQVPALIIGAETLRGAFSEGIKNLTDFYPAIMRYFAPEK